MAVTRNGWDIIPSSSSPRLVNFPWITGKVRGGDHYVVLNYIAQRWDAEVQKITKAHSWGYAVRHVRRAAGIPSEHSSGTAVDFDAPRFPIGVPASKCMSPKQIAAVRQIIKDVRGAARWGGEWSRPDAMHIELIGGNAKVRQVADLIRSGKLTGADVKPSGNVKPPATQKPSVKPPKAPSKAVQTKLKRMKLSPVVAGVKAFQKQHGLVQDGIWGKVSEAKYKANVKLQEALNKMRSTTPKLVVDGYIGTSSNRRIDNVLYRNKWSRKSLEANLKKVGALK